MNQVRQQVVQTAPNGAIFRPNIREIVLASLAQWETRSDF
jgi:hypothetical protein